MYWYYCWEKIDVDHSWDLIISVEWACFTPTCLSRSRTNSACLPSIGWRGYGASLGGWTKYGWSMGTSWAGRNIPLYSPGLVILVARAGSPRTWRLWLLGGSDELDVGAPVGAPCPWTGHDPGLCSWYIPCWSDPSAELLFGSPEVPSTSLSFLEESFAS